MYIVFNNGQKNKKVKDDLSYSGRNYLEVGCQEIVKKVQENFQHTLFRVMFFVLFASPQFCENISVPVLPLDFSSKLKFWNLSPQAIFFSPKCL